MAKILLDYFFKITTIEPTPAASTAFLKQVCVVAKPKDGVEPGSVTLCTSTAAVAALTDNADIQRLFDAGMSRVYVLLSDDLNLVDLMAAHASKFFTLLISSDFVDADIIASPATLTKADLTFTAIENGYAGNDLSIEFLDTVSAGSEVATLVSGKISVAMEGGVSTATQIKAALDANEDIAALITTTIASGQGAVAQAAFAEDDLEGGDGLSFGIFKGVIGVSSTDDDFLADQAVIANRCAFHTTSSNKGKNMFYAFGKLLSNSLNWKNQQYIQMPLADDVDELGEAENLFDLRISFVMSDDEYGDRLGFFVCGGKAITAPYIKRNLEIDVQSALLSYVSANQPAYTNTEAALIEDEAQKVLDSYIDVKRWIDSGSVEILLEQDNFVASGYFTVSEPKALWRIAGQITQQ